MRNNFTPRRLARIRACCADLLNNGIDLSTLDPPRLHALVREHLGYFQAMLGDDSSERDVVALLRRQRLRPRRHVPAIVPMRPDPSASPPADASFDPDARRARLDRRRAAMAHMTLDELVAVARDLRRRSAEMAEQMDLVRERLEALQDQPAAAYRG